MDINTHEKFDLMLTFDCWHPFRPGERPKRPDLIGFMVTEVDSGYHSMILTLSDAIFYILRAAQ